jgi:hypothetical protein
VSASRTGETCHRDGKSAEEFQAGSSTSERHPSLANPHLPFVSTLRDIPCTRESVCEISCKSYDFATLATSWELWIARMLRACTLSIRSDARGRASWNSEEERNSGTTRGDTLRQIPTRKSTVTRGGGALYDAASS